MNQPQTVTSTERFMQGLGLMLLVLVLDQLTKNWIMVESEAGRLPITLFPFANLALVWNTGVSFGMFQYIEHGHLILTSLTSAFVVGLLIWLFRSKDIFEISALGLIIGGAIGNIWDRLRFGAVVDFLDFHIAGYHWPVFNIADSAICIGVGLLMIHHFFFKS